MSQIKLDYKYLFYIFLFAITIVLAYTANTLSISYKEALNVFVNNSLLSILTNTSIYIFGQNDLALRLPFLIFYILSVILMFKLTEDFFKHEIDRFISIIIFMLLPGMLSASILVNSAIVVTFFTLLYIYNYKKTKEHSYILLTLFLFLDNSFAIFFLALFFYSLNIKDNKLFVISLIFFGISMGIYGFDTGGKPKGFFVDTFGIYASIFSPLIFLYFIYAIYRIAIKETKDIIWYIAATSLLFSLIFSLRQRVYIEDYAPFVIIFLPYMIRLFMHTYRIRLPQFRYRHKYFMITAVFILFLNSLLTIYNKPIYLLVEKSKDHFAYKYNFVKDLAYELKKKGINEVESDNDELLLRLKFYGIEEGNKFYLTMNKLYFYDLEITMDYLGKDLFKAYVIKNR